MEPTQCVERLNVGIKTGVRNDTEMFGLKHCVNGGALDWDKERVEGAGLEENTSSVVSYMLPLDADKPAHLFLSLLIHLSLPPVVKDGWSNANITSSTLGSYP